MASSYTGEESSQIVLNLPSRRAFVVELENEIMGSFQEVTQENDITPASENNSTTASAPTIFRVPSPFRDQNEKDYEPENVCIGPLHRNNSKFRSIEEDKRKCLRNILTKQRSDANNSSTAGDKLVILGESIYGRLADARNEYEAMELKDDDFAKMLVVDGCFVIAVLLAWTGFTGYRDFISSEVSLPILVRELMLFENQLPFFVLEALYEKVVAMIHLDRINLVDLVLRCIRPSHPPTMQIASEDVHHLLHVKYLYLERQAPAPHYRKSVWEKMPLVNVLMPGLIRRVSFYKSCCSFGVAKTNPAPPLKTRCATELLEEGVKFKGKTAGRYQRTDDLRISFRDGILEIPSLFVSHSTLAEMRNLIAFEQYGKEGLQFVVTSYSLFLHHLIESPIDVAVLRRSKILESKHLSDAEIAEKVSGLCQNLPGNPPDNLLFPVYAALDNFCKLPHHKWLADLVKNYISSPWKICSVIAVCLLLIFSGTTTFFTVFRTK